MAQGVGIVHGEIDLTEGESEDTLRHGKLIRISGVDQNEILLRESPVSIGRSLSNKVVWHGLQVSRRHAKFEYKDGRWFVYNLSSNGVSVNGSTVHNGCPRELDHLDIIMFIPNGAVQYRFLYTDMENEGNSTSNVSPSSLSAIIPKRGPDIYLGDDEDLLDLSDNNSNTSSEFELRVSSLNLQVPSRSDKHQSSPSKSKKRSLELDDDKNASCDVKKAKSCANDEVCEELPDLSDEDDSFLAKLFLGSHSHVNEYSKSTPKDESKNDISNDSGSPLSCDVDSLEDPFRMREKFKKYINGYKSLREQLRAANIELGEAKINQEFLNNRICEIQSEAVLANEEVLAKVLKALETEFTCPVCSEIIIEATVIDCGHTLCNHCISEWTQRQTFCPMCRKHVTSKSRHIEVENLLRALFNILPDEVQSKRKALILERQTEVERAAQERDANRRNVHLQRRGGLLVHELDNHMMQQILDAVQQRQRPGPRGRGRARSTVRGGGRGMNVSVNLGVGGDPALPEPPRTRSTRASTRSTISTAASASAGTSRTQVSRRGGGRGRTLAQPQSVSYHSVIDAVANDSAQNPPDVPVAREQPGPSIIVSNLLSSLTSFLSGSNAMNNRANLAEPQAGPSGIQMPTANRSDTVTLSSSTSSSSDSEDDLGYVDIGLPTVRSVEEWFTFGPPDEDEDVIVIE